MPWLLNAIEYVALFLSIWTLVVIINEVLREYQSHRYALKSFGKVLKYFYLQDRTQILYPLCLFFFFLDRWYVQIIFGAYLTFLIVWKWLQKSEPTEPYNGRLQRLFALMVVLETIAATLLHYAFSLPQLMSSIILLMFSAPFVVFIGALILWPWEGLIQKAKSPKRDY
jgi:hypothetical protein